MYVCLSEFNIKQYSREELMLEFTGDEIENMIDEGYYIVSGKESSNHNKQVMEKYNNNIELIDNITHWTNAVFLITSIIKNETGNITKDGVHGVSLTRKILLENYTKYLLIWQQYSQYYNVMSNLYINHFKR